MINNIAFIQDDRNIITYRPRWNEITGSINATILLQQITYRWRGKPFYKFYKPCPEHPEYRKGDSWLEELGMGRYEFYNARKAIGAQVDAGAPDETTFVSYWTDGYRRTWYFLNEKLLLEKLAEIYPAITPTTTPSQPAKKDGLSAILNWMKFTGRMTDKDSLALPEQILAWALWARLNEGSLKKQEKNPVAIARASWRKGDWPNQTLADLARRELDVILAADVPEVELDALLQEIESPSSQIPDEYKDIIIS